MKRIFMFMIVGLFFLAGCNTQNNDAASSEMVTSEQNAGQAQEEVKEATTKSDDEFLILATTTSTQDSGLLDELIPIFEEQTGYMVKTIAVGTGKALEMGDSGEADVLLVHAPDAEMALVENGSAINRQLVMHNDFVIIGPSADPAGIKEIETAAEALLNIRETESLFVSRGDDSGTHKMELSFWEELEIEPAGQWYQETGQGMGATIRVASDKQGYTLTDRATFLALKDEIELEILLENDEKLLNIYHVMQVNPEKFEKVKEKPAKLFVEFLISEEAQSIIEEFGVEEYGEPLFFPDAK